MKQKLFTTKNHVLPGRKIEKIRKLFDPNERILLADFLAPYSVRKVLIDYLGITSEHELLDQLNVDFYYLSFRDLSQNESLLPYYKGHKLFMDDKIRKCPFGITWKRGAYKDKFAVDEAMKGPFTSFDTTEKDILNFDWPDPQAFRYEGLVEECERYKDKIIIGGLWSAIHGDSYRMMGYENFLLNIALNRPLIKTLINRVTEFYLLANRKYFEAVKGKMDVFFMGNDFGAQNGLLISEEDWIDLYYENYRQLIELAHSFGFRVMVHSCGGIRPLLPHFIRMGVDILDPVQTTAAGMEPACLSEDFGRNIVFHGAIDTQHILPERNRGEVYKYSLEMIDTLNKFGNFVLAPSNNIMPGTPVQNILAMYQAARDWLEEQTVDDSSDK